MDEKHHHQSDDDAPRYSNPARAAGADALTVWQRLQQQQHPGGRTPTAPMDLSTQRLTEQFMLRKEQRLARRRRLRHGVAAALLVGLFAFALVAAEAYVAQHPRTTVTLLPSEFVAPQLDWLAPQAKAVLAERIEASLRAQLEAHDLVDEQGRIALLSRGALERIRDALSASPWVHSVAQVRIEPAGRLDATLRLRRPQAALETAEGVVLLDDEGVVLPLNFTDSSSFRRFNEQVVPSLRLLSGAYGLEVPAPGQRFTAAAVEAGLAVDAMLDPFAEHLRIFAIDVSNVGGARSRAASEVTLLAQAPAGHLVEIDWGRDPAHARFGESPVGAKLARLERLLEASPSLEGYERIDLRFATLDGR